MHSNLLTTTLLATLLTLYTTTTTASSIPLPRALSHNSPRTTTDTCTHVPSWPATNYIWGCSPGGCSSRFNLTAPIHYYSSAPSFSVVCSPIFIQQGWVPCVAPDNSPLPETSRVEAIWTDGPVRERQYLAAAHIWKRDDGKWVNVTAWTDILPVGGRGGPPMDFEFPIKLAIISG